MRWFHQEMAEKRETFENYIEHWNIIIEHWILRAWNASREFLSFCSIEFPINSLSFFSSYLLREIIRRVWVKRIMAINCVCDMHKGPQRNCSHCAFVYRYTSFFITSKHSARLWIWISSATCKAKVKCQFHFHAIFDCVCVFFLRLSGGRIKQFMYRSCKKTTSSRFIWWSIPAIKRTIDNNKRDNRSWSTRTAMCRNGVKKRPEKHRIERKRTNK